MKHLNILLAALLVVCCTPVPQNKCQGVKANELSQVLTKDDPVILTQVPLSNLNEESKAGYLADLRKSGVSVVLISATDFIYDEQTRSEKLEQLSRYIRYFEDEGYPVALWTTTLGYGRRRPALDAIHPNATKLTSFGGKTSGAVCTTDTLFLKMMQRNMQDFVRAGARMILLDDELVQSVRPGFCCTCDEHLRRFAQKVGRKYTREEVRDLFTGAPSKERTAYMEVMGESLWDFCKGLREAVDEVDPEVFMCICSSFTHFNAEGVDMFELSKLLAGQGRRPMLRLSGAPYWASFSQRVPGQTLGEVADFVRMQIGWMRDKDIILWDENDSYPHVNDMVPASWSELYDKIMIANGGVHRHKYFLRIDPLSPDRSYIDAHQRNMKRDRDLIEMFKGTAPLGFRVWETEHNITEINLPEEYPGNWRLMGMITHSFSSMFLTENSIPSRFEGIAPGIAFGDQAALLPPEALSMGLILDVPAALALQAKGIDVGLKGCEPCEKQGRELFGDFTNSFLTNDGRFFRITPCEGAEVLSTFVSATDTIPACVLTHTSDGVFAIYAWEGRSITPGRCGDQRGLWYSPERQDQLAYIYKEMSGGEPLPAFTRRHPGLYVLAAGSEEKAAVLLCNISADAIINLDLAIPEGWILKGGNKLKSIPAYEWCAVELKRK